MFLCFRWICLRELARQLKVAVLTQGISNLLLHLFWLNRKISICSCNNSFKIRTEGFTEGCLRVWGIWEDNCRCWGIYSSVLNFPLSIINHNVLSNREIIAKLRAFIESLWACLFTKNIILYLWGKCWNPIFKYMSLSYMEYNMSRYVELENFLIWHWCFSFLQQSI